MKGSIAGTPLSAQHSTAQHGVHGMAQHDATPSTWHHTALAPHDTTRHQSCDTAYATVCAWAAKTLNLGGGLLPD